MKLGKILIIVLGVLLTIILANGFYTVDETQQVVITQFGKPIGNAITKAGLHWKIPFIQSINSFDKRILAWDGDPNQIPTKGKKYIWLDLTARWRITDPLKFLQSVENETGAHGRLDDIVDAVTRDFVSNNILIELVRNSNEPLTGFDEETSRDTVLITEKIEFGRENITHQILKQASELVPQFGIELIDVKIKRINYVEEVRRKVYERMVSERTRIAGKYRSEGQGQMAEIEGKRDRELKIIRSQAYQKAQEIRGRADAEATRIYARAYNNDPEFYSFLKTLDTYKATLDSNTTLLLTTKAEYLKYLKGVK